jgi:hypothetical protein
VAGLCLIALLAASVSSSAQAAKPLKDAQIKEALVKASIASYSGSCPCPFNVDRAGRRCGKRSAYAKPGGKSPICYVADVTAKMIDAYRAALASKQPVTSATK